jgi:L-threonylcarbamoyladenylate synthase
MANKSLPPVIVGLNNPQVASYINEGMVGVLPTDTVYGIACSCKNIEAVKKLYAAKDRDTKPGTIIAADIAQVQELGINIEDNEVLKKYWPGPVSLILSSPKSLKYLSLSQDSLAIRVPSNIELRDLLQKTGPLVTSSANPPGLKTANTITEAQEYFGNKVDFYIDGGDLSSNKPSTIINIQEGKEVILRA